MKNKTPSFRTKLWLCFVFFASVIFSILWLLQTVFLQRFCNQMLAANTRKAAEEIAACSREENITDLIDQLSQENSLLVYITDSSGTIYYHSDSYQSYYSAFENPYHSDETMGWEIGVYRNLPDGYGTFLNTILASENGTAEYETDTKYVYGTSIQLPDGQSAILYTSASLEPVRAAVSILRMQLIWVTILSLLIAFLLSWLLAKRFSIPVHQLAIQAEQLADGTSKPIEAQ